ncbi:hypothetical protein COHA_003206 [Chlorella ohadii]|uniref:AB hydrolase-1 domain-containing protein n=1 Tax=Chlorella ohadii TaxID=2649997 RepID=A0AAD5DVV6_9CHLO|nr:hypothetical protein COHA_003206 [Chlorella ohadii]
MAGVVKQRRLMIELASAQLEGLLFEAPERERGAAAVILHPYAPLGGSMHDHMVLELFRAAAQSRAFRLVLRYNQRGVGRSSGWKNWLGGDDQRDVLDVVEWAAARLTGPEKHVAVIGYSWGSCLAAHGLSHPAVAAYVGVSVPLGGMAWVLQTKKHFGEVCRAIHVPRLLLLGDQDQFTGTAAMHTAVRENGGLLLRQDDSFQPEADAHAAASTAAGSSSSGTIGGSGSGGSGGGGGVHPGAERRELLLRIFPGDDHFWMSHGNVAAAYAVRWLEAQLLATQQQQEQQQQQAASPVQQAAAAEGG